MLREHQVAPASHLLEVLRCNDAAVDFSDMGTGKTAVAVWTAKQLGLPTLVVCPDICQSAWHRMAALFEDSLSVINYESLRTGKTPYGWWAKPDTKRTYKYKCVNCKCKLEPTKTMPACFCHHLGIHCIDTQKVSAPRGAFSFHDNVKMVIFDEVHRCNSTSSLNADMLIAAKRDNKKILALSATAAHTPLHFRALGYALGLHGLANFYSWAYTKGVRRLPGQGFQWQLGAEKQREVMAGINAQLFPGKGIRMRIQDIPDFPEVDIASELYDIGHESEINGLYQQMRTELSELSDTAAFDKDAENPLTQRLRLRQKIELLKVPLAEQLTRDYRAKGFSVAVFCNFSATLDALSKRLETNLVLSGENTSTERDFFVESFQRNHRGEILINNKVGGAGLSLPDLDGAHPRVGLVMPSDSVLDMEQIFGRLRRTDSKSKSHYRVLLAAGTCEEKIDAAFKRSSNNIKAMNDGDLRPEL